MDRFGADISRGRTREKINYPDPAAAPFGTDDEAAGMPASLRERRMEDAARPEPCAVPPASQGPIIFYVSLVVALAVGITFDAYFLR